MKKKSQSYNTHLTLDDRKAIQKGIENNATKTAIALLIGKDNSTVGKEIKSHRLFYPHRFLSFNKSSVSHDSCKYRDRSPGACNGCQFYKTCKKTRYFYDALKAQTQYEHTLVTTREGIMLCEDQVRRIGKLIAPLIEQGQSIAQIYVTHSQELRVSEKTLYHYIDQGVFRDYGILNLSLKEKVNRKPRATKHKQRKSPANYTGHTYKDYQELIASGHDFLTVEMDTLYNNPKGPFLQTLILSDCMLMIGFLHTSKTAQSMASTLDTLQDALGTTRYKKIFGLLLADRGTEFETHSLFEFDKNGERRSLIYYCDPMCPHQKPHVENNHNYVRDILPNSFDLLNLSQKDIDKIFLHINNTPRLSKGKRTPIEILEFLYKEDYEALMKAFKLYKLHPDEVKLTPQLLKSKQ